MMTGTRRRARPGKPPDPAKNPASRAGSAGQAELGERFPARPFVLRAAAAPASALATLRWSAASSSSPKAGSVRSVVQDRGFAYVSRSSGGCPSYGLVRSEQGFGRRPVRSTRAARLHGKRHSRAGPGSSLSRVAIAIEGAVWRGKMPLLGGAPGRSRRSGLRGDGSGA
jgi:hypothetical protein